MQLFVCQVNFLEDKMEKFTQGPWKWLVNKESKKVEL
jgi:hypothetical protein